MEPLQDRAVEVNTEVQEPKTNMAQTHLECARMVSNEIAV